MDTMRMTMPYRLSMSCRKNAAWVRAEVAALAGAAGTSWVVGTLAPLAAASLLTDAALSPPSPPVAAPSPVSSPRARSFRYAMPTMAAKMTTAMVDVGRLPAKSANTFTGMNDRIICGSDRFATCCWSACSACMPASAPASVKLAPARPESATAAHPVSAATATVPSSTASTTALMRPRFSEIFVRVNAPTMATNTSGITSIFSSAM